MKIGVPTAVLVLIVGAILATLFLFSRSSAAEAVYPVERMKVFFSRSVVTRVKGAFSGMRVAAENKKLKRELELLTLIREDIEKLEAENARLRKMLGYTERQKQEWIPAAVLARDGGSAGAHRMLRVDKGSLAGIRAGAVVVVPDGLVGRVASVSPHTADVRLLSDASVKVACEIETGEANPPRGILSGGSDDLLVLKNLMRTNNVPARARVLTSGLGGRFPRGIEVGTFLSDGLVLPAVEPSALQDVFIRREK